MKKKLYFKIINISLLLFFEISFSQASLIKDMYIGSNGGNPLYIKKLQNIAVFNGSKSGIIEELRITDGTFFKADNGTVGTELWVTDGTETGTVLVKDISIGSASSDPNNLINVNGTLFFTANTDLFNTDQLWKSDGSEGRTVLVKNSHVSSTSNANTGTQGGTYMRKDIKTDSTDGSVGNITAFGNEVFFSALGDNGIFSFWKSDGTNIGTTIVETDLNFYSLPNYSTTAIYNDKFYFVANDNSDTVGKELWVSDGTLAGTFLLKDISSGKDSSNPNNFIVYHNLLYFRATQASTGEGLLATDVTPQGTEMVIDNNSGSFSSSPDQFIVIRNALYFVANEGVYGQELWKTNGTLEGTVRLTDIKIRGACCSNVQYITEINNIIKGNDDILGYELWRLDQEAFSIENLSFQSFKVYPNPTSIF